MGHSSHQYPDIGEIARAMATALKYPQVGEGHVETINHKQVIKIKSILK